MKEFERGRHCLAYDVGPTVEKCECPGCGTCGVESRSAVDVRTLRRPNGVAEERVLFKCTVCNRRWSSKRAGGLAAG